MLQEGTEEWDRIYAAAGADDGSVTIAGNTLGSYGAENAGNFDFVAIKIDRDGNTIWRWQVRRTRLIDVAGFGHACHEKLNIELQIDSFLFSQIAFHFGSC